ncbi:MAG TPA: aminomethyl-transferring glycine dehydrogenase subunit GcvPA [bacterium]|nr:aminomethyl-transferring glycine dehydrogenase subunit GcvPA [bacterium]
MRFIPNNEPARKAMLAEMGLPDIEALFAGVPSEVRLQRPLQVPPGMAEEEQLQLFSQLAARNEAQQVVSFLGAGSYPHYAPLVIDSLIQRAEFFTAYTPYQPEISQGTLQAIFEFQTFMTHLTGLDIANASVYDGASATAEAVLMADRLARGRSRVLLTQALHPHYRRVVDTHTHYLDVQRDTVPADPATGRMDVAALERLLDEDVACVVVQQPNVYGVIEDLAAIAAPVKRAGALLIVTVSEALSLALLEAPGALGADIVCGEAQSFGVPVAYGGPYLGFMATRDEHKRQLPGRIAGETVDADGQRGYVLTLATREQHIRRERATSNICTNENLVMLSALIYLTTLGRAGLLQVARQNVSLLAYLRERIAALPGYAAAFSGPSFNELAVRCPRPAAEVVQGCLRRGVLPGLDLGRWDAGRADTLLLAVTETKTRAHLDALVNALREVAA